MPTTFIVDQLDRNGDRHLAVEEFSRAAGETLDYMGVRNARARSDVLDYYARLHAAADADGDGLLSEREVAFSELMARTYGVSFDALAAGGTEDVASAASRSRRPADFGEEWSTEIIAQHDIDGDGRISRAEYMRGMLDTVSRAGMGSSLDDPDVLAWLDAIFARADLNDNGWLELKEALYVSLIFDEGLESDFARARYLVHAMLSYLDKDGDGALDLKEVDAVADRAGGTPAGHLGDAPFSALLRHIDLVRSHFGGADADGDGRVVGAEAVDLARRVLSEADRGVVA